MSEKQFSPLIFTLENETIPNKINANYTKDPFADGTLGRFCSQTARLNQLKHKGLGALPKAYTLAMSYN